MKKVIFITGASSGLGRATALLFAARGWTVYAGVRPGSEQAAGLAEVHGVIVLPVDVTIPEQIEQAAARVLADGPVDLVFANAGYALGGPLESLEDEQIVKQLGTNLLGPVRTVKAFLPAMRKQGHGGFLVTASAAGYVGMPLLSIYSASKFALVGWAESLAFELPPGIFVKLIVPGSMKTNFLSVAERASHPAYADLVARTDKLYAGATDNAHDGTPGEVAAAIWDAANDGSAQVVYFVTEEARATVAAREALGAQKFRQHILQLLGI